MADGAIIGSVGVAVVPNAEDFWRRFKAQTEAGKANAEPELRVKLDTKDAEGRLAALKAQIARTESSIKVKADTKDAQKQIGLLSTAIFTLGPAIVPIAGAAAAAGAGLVGMGVVGIVALKGIEAEMKSGSKAGVLYTTQIGEMKAAFAGLSSTVATGFLPGFAEAIQKFRENAPQLQVALSGSAHALGDITQHLVGGLINGFLTFNPLMVAAQGEVEKLAARFETWAASPGGAHFAQTLTSDFHAVVPVLESLVVTAGHLVAAFHPVGLSVVSELGALSKVINAIPIPVLQAAATAFVAYRTAVALTFPFQLATDALKKFAVAEGEAAAAGGVTGTGALGGIAGRLSTTLSLLKPAATAWIGLAIATNQAAKATSDYAYSNNVALRGLAGGAQIDKDLFTLHLSHLGQDLHPNAARNKLVDQQNQYSAALDDIRQGQSMLTTPAAAVAGGNQVLSQKFQGPSHISTDYAHDAQIIGDAQAYAAAQAKAWSTSVDTVARSMAYLHQQIGAVPVSQAAQGYNAVQQSIQRNVDTIDAFTKLGGRTVETYRGVAIGQNTLDAALQQTNGDYHAAIGLIEGQIEAMQNNRSVINDLIDRQRRLADFQGDVTTKFGLSTAQVDLFAEAMGLSADKITNSNASLHDAETTFGQFAKTVQNGSTALQGWIGDVDAFNKAGDTAASRGMLIGQALVAANGDTIAFQGALAQVSAGVAQFGSDLKSSSANIVNWKTGLIDVSQAGAAPLIADLATMQTNAENSAAAIYQHETALGKAGAADDAFRAYLAGTSGALVDQHTQLGITSDQAHTLADRYFSIKNVGDLKKQIELIGQDKVVDALTGILRDLDAIAGRHEADLLLKGTIDAPAMKILDVVQPGHTAQYTIRGAAGVITTALAEGGWVAGPGGPKEDRVPILASDGEFVVNAAAASQNRTLLENINKGVRGFAAGGTVHAATLGDLLGQRSTDTSPRQNVFYITTTSDPLSTAHEVANRFQARAI